MSRSSSSNERVGGESSVVSGERSVRAATHHSPLTTHECSVKLAEGLISALSKNMQNGHLFRVDLRIRPEGRFGALVRSLQSYQAYYESWAEPWEFQALLKARFVAGDPALGEAFMKMIAPYLFRRAVNSEFIDSIRHNKARMEQKAQLSGEAQSNVKTGFGGIRDVEFTVQLLQLRLGSRFPQVRTPNTLDALGRLRHVGALTIDEESELTEDYKWLRNVEHRLQILYDRQTQLLPAEPNERRLLARRMGYPDAAAFDADYVRRTDRVRRHFTRLFLDSSARDVSAQSDRWATLVESIESVDSQSRIREELLLSGFREADRIVAAMRAAAVGTDYGGARPESRRLFTTLAGRLIAAASRTGDPDAAYMAVDSLAMDSPNRAEIYHTLSESGELLDRICSLAAGSPSSIHVLARHPEWLDMLVSEEVLDHSPKTRENHLQELRARLAPPKLNVSGAAKRKAAAPAPGAAPSEHFWAALATYIQRERLRIAARDLWEEIAASTTARELTNLAEAVLQTLLDVHRAHVATRFAEPAAQAALDSVAIIGLGKLGGGELGYASDWDILFVYASDHSTEPSTNSFAALNALAEAILASGQELRTRGAPVEIDARLRPEGRFGQLARTVEEYQRYYRESALTWERQTLTKARHVAGDPSVGEIYLLETGKTLFHQLLSDAEQLEIRQMKGRIEAERLKPEERYLNLKLGYGGMSDIEFTAQLYQLIHGRNPTIARAQNTIECLHALAASRFIPAPEASRLAEAYSFWMALRNRLALRGLRGDVLPDDATHARAVAFSLGFTDSGAERAEVRLHRHVEDRMKETREIVERLFHRPGNALRNSAPTRET